MAVISIDSQESSFEIPQNSNIAEAIQIVLTQLPKNKVITHITLDGRSIETVEVEKDLTLPYVNLNQIEVTTVDKEVWSIHGIETAYSCAERIQQSLIRVAELFRENQIARGNQLLVQCVDGLEKFYDAITISRTINKLDFDAKAGNFSLSQLEKTFSLILKSIVSCQEQQDYLLLSDRIEYELIPNLSHWSAHLRASSELAKQSLQNS